MKAYAKRPLAAPTKKRRDLKKKPAPGSLAWYRAEWATMSKDHLPEAIIAGLAQLSYENKALRKRVEALEAFQLAQVFGRVEHGVPHLPGCGKGDDPQASCTCGSLPHPSSGRASS